MEDGDSKNYYGSRKAKLMKDFDRMAGKMKDIIVSRYGKKEADGVVADARKEFEALIPRLPYSGGDRNPYTAFIVSSGWVLALYRAMKARGRTAEDVGQVVNEMFEAYFRAIPGWLFKLRGLWVFSPFYKHNLKKRALESQQRRYPEGYLFYYVPGDGKAFDFGIDFEECATCKFLKAEGAEVLAKYLCDQDFRLSELQGTGLIRTKAIGHGEDRKSVV